MNVFEIVTPAKSFLLQATSASEKEQWVAAITVSLEDRDGRPLYRVAALQAAFLCQLALLGFHESRVSHAEGMEGSG